MTSAASVPGHGEVMIGRVFARAGAMARGRAGSMLIIAVVLAALPTPIRLFGSEAFARMLRGASGQLSTYLLASLASVIFGGLCSGALVRLALAAEDGDRGDAAHALIRTLRSGPRLIGLYLMIEIAVGIATVMLVVPGIMLATALWVAMPVAVAEGRGGTRAFDRSFDLTRGARWRVFAILAIYLVAVFAAGALVGAIRLEVPMTIIGLPVVGLVAQAILAIVTTITGAVLQSSLYVELRTWKEGAPQEELREIFA